MFICVNFVRETHALEMERNYLVKDSSLCVQIHVRHYNAFLRTTLHASQQITEVHTLINEYIMHKQ